MVYLLLKNSPQLQRDCQPTCRSAQASLACRRPYHGVVRGLSRVLWHRHSALPFSMPRTSVRSYIFRSQSLSRLHRIRLRPFNIRRPEEQLFDYPWLRDYVQSNGYIPSSTRSPLTLLQRIGGLTPPGSVCHPRFSCTLTDFWA